MTLKFFISSIREAIDMRSTLLPLKIIVVPGWIERSLIRNRLNTIDILDYSKIRNILSIDDMATLFYVNNGLKIDNSYLSSNLLESNFTSLTTAQNAELSNSVLPLSRSEDIAISATERLSGSNPMSNCTYSFITIDNTIFLVLNEGFISSIVEPKNKLDFIRDYLKKCYGSISIPEVSYTDMFKLYVKQF